MNKNKLDVHRKRVGKIQYPIRYYIYFTGFCYFITIISIIGIFRFNTWIAIIPALIFALLSFGGTEYVYSYWYIKNKEKED